MVEEDDEKDNEKEAEEEYEQVLVGKDAKKNERIETPKPAKPNQNEYKPAVPFPSRLRSTKREREDEDIMRIFL